jgi:hypothetical protein
MINDKRKKKYLVGLNVAEWVRFAEESGLLAWVRSREMNWEIFLPG